LAPLTRNPLISLEIFMVRPCLSSRGLLALGVGLVMVAGIACAAAQTDFPFGREVLLDTKPMKGSKRVPSLDIAENGLAEIDLWCNSVKGQMVVAGDTITIITGAKTDRSCPPERMRGDEEVLAALNEVTNWRLEGDILVLTGARTLRFRVPTN